MSDGKIEKNEFIQVFFLMAFHALVTLTYLARYDVRVDRLQLLDLFLFGKEWS